MPSTPTMHVLKQTSVLLTKTKTDPFFLQGLKHKYLIINYKRY